MLKVLKLLSIASISIPLVLVSCSQNIQSKTSTIGIDRSELEKNFAKATTEPTFTTSQIEKFIMDFNENPENYFITQTPANSSSTIFPFITADINSFSENKINETISKPNIRIEKSSNTTPSFETIKFIFELKPEYKPEIIIMESPTVTLNPLDTDAFSMDFRVMIPAINTEQRTLEINWIKGFFAKSFIKFISEEIKEQTYAKTATTFASEITNKTEFEKVFQMSIPFPSQIVTGWEYDVKAMANPNSNTSVILEFSLTNNLFTGESSLTVEESTTHLILDGFASE